ncbi:hypothetical protein G7Y89_g1517 [Cudoniella acicularis]|uniref:Alpha/beta hydrolase fold-3 domain-containing protein n=1 Tax=Cudoniella acicularis TaxID=354080 RepID=A0A8H4RW59_9HELO|nr:hypothetical protein G7Y89_g1517 [Cudoniella acicularis]
MGDSEGFAEPWLAFEKQIGQRFLLYGPIEKANDQYLEFGGLLVSKLTFPAPDASVKTEDKEISPGLKVRIYTPPNYSGNKPVCLFFHGGGWAMGDLEGEDGQCRYVSKEAGVVVVSVDYRLAPANPYPIPFDDCFIGYEWALKNSASLKTTPNQAFTFGTSAGANLALAVALKVIDEGRGDTLKGVVAVVPVTIDPAEVPAELKSKYTSYAEHDEHTINTGKAMKMFFDAYGADGKDPYVSPLLHKKLKELPKVYIAVSSQDTLRDDGSVPTVYDEYLGYPHWFWAYPSEHLKEPIAEYNRNLKKGFDFVLSPTRSNKI